MTCLTQNVIDRIREEIADYTGDLNPTDIHACVLTAAIFNLLTCVDGEEDLPEVRWIIEHAFSRAKGYWNAGGNAEVASGSGYAH